VDVLDAIFEGSHRPYINSPWEDEMDRQMHGDAAARAAPDTERAT
jgi:hypothetical protein